MTTTAGTAEGAAEEGDAAGAGGGTGLERAWGGMLPKGMLGLSSGMRTASPTIVVLPTGCTTGAEEGGCRVALTGVESAGGNSASGAVAATAGAAAGARAGAAVAAGS